MATVKAIARRPTAQLATWWLMPPRLGLFGVIGSNDRVTQTPSAGMFDSPRTKSRRPVDAASLRDDPDSACRSLKPGRAEVHLGDRNGAGVFDVVESAPRVMQLLRVTLVALPGLSTPRRRYLVRHESRREGVVLVFDIAWCARERHQESGLPNRRRQDKWQRRLTTARGPCTRPTAMT